MKIVILMTDGDHFAEERLNDNFKAGVTGANGTHQIFKSPYDGNYSIRFPHRQTGGFGQQPVLGAAPQRMAVASLDQYLKHRRLLAATRSTLNSCGVKCACNGWSGSFTPALLEPTTANARPSITLDDVIREQTPTNHMDSQLQQQCARARENGITVYGIAFEAPSAGQAQISQCATSSAHYFNAAGLQISTAFRAIASNISHLRLTQ